MFEKLKNLLTPPDDKKLHEAEVRFDDLMGEVELAAAKDSDGLKRLEGHVRTEFDKLNGDVNDIREDVDRVVGEKSAPEGK